jgi:hypothetical protein
MDVQLLAWLWGKQRKRATKFEPGGQEFESLPAGHIYQALKALPKF